MGGQPIGGEALRCSWETPRRAAELGMADGYRDHVDHQLSVLLPSRDPFSLCSPDCRDLQRPVPVQDQVGERCQQWMRHLLPCSPFSIALLLVGHVVCGRMSA